MESIKKILPLRIAKALDKLDKSRLCEIRIREGGVSVNYGGRFFMLSEVGLSTKGIKMEQNEIEEVVLKASEYSIYAVNEQIKNGYIALSGGVRIGLCGEVVEGKTIKNFCSLNIRFPHEVKGCANEAIKYVAKDKGCYNTLIVSPPGCGKTTLLRDLIRQLSQNGNNVLVADERYELAGEKLSLDVGRCSDVISGASKEFVFRQGLRYMRPDIIATDEIMSDCDVRAINQACIGGVNVIATIHADGFNYKRRYEKMDFAERIILLSDREGPGHVDGVFLPSGEQIA